MRFNRDKYRQLMKDRGMKAVDICRLTGISEKSFSWLMESGVCEVCTYECLADAVGIAVSEILLPDYSDVEHNIEFLRDEKMAAVSFTQGRYITRIKALSKKHPKDCQIVAESKSGSICAHIPVNWIKIGPPRSVSEEQRIAASVRMKKIRAGQISGIRENE